MQYIKAFRSLVKFPKNKKSAQFKKIEELQQRIIQAGYQPAEADYFLHNQIGEKKLSELSNAQLDNVVSQLQAQVNIAQKCHNLIFNKA